MTPIKTKRLILRPWKQEDLEPFTKLNADPRVMKHFLSTLSEEQSHQIVLKIQINMQKTCLRLLGQRLLTDIL